MNYFTFTFKKGDQFKHTFQSIEKYVHKNVVQNEKFKGKARINIQVFVEGGTTRLTKDLNQLFLGSVSEDLYIQVFNGDIPTILKHICVIIKYDTENKVWTVTNIIDDYHIFFSSYFS